ncbi:hypothetical protein [Streptomyces sp. NPDC017991]|uniref:hypothetical protein n=1 Tax=Streptomyces sp. NPDC017991 TaxID=3365026 RepID=UPI0037A29F5A
MIGRSCEVTAAISPALAGKKFTPRGFRRLFAIEIVTGGLPIHIGAALLGPLNLRTAQGYVAAFAEDIVQHYLKYLDQPRPRTQGTTDPAPA